MKEIGVNKGPIYTVSQISRRIQYVKLKINCLAFCFIDMYCTCDNLWHRWVLHFCSGFGTEVSHLNKF